MAGCRHLSLMKDEDSPNPGDPDFYWWCEKLEKYADFRGCTIIPCQGKAMNGCEDADFTDYFKRHGFKMAVTVQPEVPA